MADSVDLQQRLCLRVLRLGQLLDLSIVLLDFDRHLRDPFEHGTERLRETWGITARPRWAKQRVEEAGILWPQDFVNPRTEFTAAMRKRTMRSRARFNVRASCCYRAVRNGP
jgi:hypothetical protein